LSFIQKFVYVDVCLKLYGDCAHMGMYYVVYLNSGLGVLKSIELNVMNAKISTSM